MLSQQDLAAAPKQDFENNLCSLVLDWPRQVRYLLIDGLDLFQFGLGHLGVEPREDYSDNGEKNCEWGDDREGYLGLLHDLITKRSGVARTLLHLLLRVVYRDRAVIPRVHQEHPCAVALPTFTKGPLRRERAVALAAARIIEAPWAHLRASLPCPTFAALALCV